jgi:cytochrome c-type biogenesis protein CcsB
MTALGSNDFSHTILFGVGDKVTVNFADYSYTKENGHAMGMLSVEVCYKGTCKIEKLIGQRNMKGYPKKFTFDGVDVAVEFGSKVLILPFSVKLRDFQLDRYPGSMAPSSYASEVTVLDGDTELDYRIYMNHTLDYGSYKFFQSSYDQDELGTVLSVNDDPGKWPTYLGYLLLVIGFMGNFFAKQSRFSKLIRYVKHSSMLFALLFVMGTGATSLHAEESAAFNSYLDSYAKGSASTAEKFAALMVQAPMGRMEPVDSLNAELLYKLHGSLSFEGLDKNQVIMGMLSRPELWRDAKLMKIKSPKLKDLLGMQRSEKYAAFSDAFVGSNQYKLKEAVEQSNRINPNKRGTFEREVIAMDEKLNVIYMVFYGNLFKIYPLENDPSNAWYNPLKAMDKFAGKAKIAVEKMTRGLIDTIGAKDWDGANRMIEQIRNYQYRYGKALIPSQSKIEAEFFYNKLNLFPRLVGIYMILGMLLLIAGFAQIVANSKAGVFVWIQRLAVVTVFLLFLAHTFGLGLRWYISGHAPWSDSYESLLYISWSAMLAGIVFFRRSLLVLSATIVVAGIFMFTAHLSHINPQITNLVPVLKSYWLTIHVSIITASYGFLGLGAVISYIVLLLFIIRNPEKRPHIDQSIYGLMAVTEAALIIGLAMLTAGNFLGGVWANESWGRYWGWDPKETWAYVSIVVYTFVLHLRLVKRLNTPYVLAAGAFVAFASILMTYFGVNFYLSGMHSYATGDPLPIPTWVYAMTALAFVTIVLAYPKRGLPRLKLPSK